MNNLEFKKQMIDFKRQREKEYPFFQEIFKKYFPHYTLSCMGNEESLILINKFNEIQNKELSFGEVSELEFDIFIELIISKFIDSDVIVVLYNFKYIGGIKFKLHELMKYSKQLLEIDKDRLYILLKDFSSGIVIDIYKEKKCNKYEYSIWGDWLEKYKSYC